MGRYMSVMRLGIRMSNRKDAIYCLDASKIGAIGEKIILHQPFNPLTLSKRNTRKSIKSC